MSVSTSEALGGSQRGVQGPLKGVLLVAGAVLMFACMNTITRNLSQLYAVPLIMAARYGVHLLLMIVVLGPSQGKRLYQTTHTGLVLVRGLCLAVSSLFVGFALQRIPVAETTSTIFLAPMVVMLVARPLLGETIGRLGWLAVVLGFAGVLLIVRPGSGVDLVGVGCIGVAIVGTVAYQLLSRVLHRTETTFAMLFQSALVGTILFGALVPFSLGGPAPSPWQLTMFILSGVAGGLGHFLFTAAYRHAPASLLAPVNYLELVWAGLLGWMVFGHIPDPLTAAGMSVVAASGVMIAIKSTRQPKLPAALIDEPIS